MCYTGVRLDIMEDAMITIDANVLHTTELGAMRIRRNLGLNVDDVVDWCKRVVLAADENDIVRKGKNWYVKGDGFVLTINAVSHTIITAHKTKG
jgi:hypothetical protein